MMRTKNMTLKPKREKMKRPGSSARALNKSDLVPVDQKHARSQISLVTKPNNRLIILSQRKAQSQILLLHLSNLARFKRIMIVVIAIQVMMRIITKDK